MTSTRNRLPNRRDDDIETLVVGGLEFRVTVGFDPATDRPRELFLDGGKAGSEFAALLADAATSISVAIQYGVPIAALAKSMGRAPNVETAPGSFEQLAAGPEPASPIGAALDLLCSLETSEPRVACKGAEEYDHR